MELLIEEVVAKLKHLNARKEGDKGEVAVDLKIEFVVRAHEMGIIYLTPTGIKGIT